MTHRLIAALVVLLTACSPEEQPPDPWMAPLQAAEEALSKRDLETAESRYREALSLAEADGHVQGQSAATEGIAMTRALSDDLPGARRLYADLLAWQQQLLLADSLSAERLVRTLGTLGEIELRQGQPDSAGARFEQILQLDRDGLIELRPESSILAYTLQGLAETLVARGRPQAADSLRRRAQGLGAFAQGFHAYVGENWDQAEQAFGRAVNDLADVPREAGQAAHLLARVYEFQGRTDKAADTYRTAFALLEQDGTAPGDQAAVADEWAALLGDTAQATDLRRQAMDLREEIAR